MRMGRDKKKGWGTTSANQRVTLSLNVSRDRRKAKS